MDVDGVLTDGTVAISSDGTETKQFSILDGMGIVRLHKAGVAVAWISGRASGSTTARATELRVPHVIQGRTDKLMALQELASQLGLAAAQVCYMGDDDIDAPAIAWAWRWGGAPRLDADRPQGLRLCARPPRRPRCRARGV